MRRAALHCERSRDSWHAMPLRRDALASSIKSTPAACVTSPSLASLKQCGFHQSRAHEHVLHMTHSSTAMATTTVDAQCSAVCIGKKACHSEGNLLRFWSLSVS